MVSTSIFGKAGRVWIAGFSFGGLVAFEMVRILRRDGERVEILGRFNTPVAERALPPGAWVRV